MSTHRRPRWRSATWIAVQATLFRVGVVCGLLIAPQPALADSLASAVFVRTDTDHTLVVSPRAHVAVGVGDATRLDASYAADVWTSASVDIRASASLPVTEQRNELDFGVSREFEDLMLTGAYRYSIENDYLSHGVSAAGALDLAENNSTIDLSGYVFFDTVGRSGTPSFSRALTTFGARASFTQVLDTSMLGQVTYEIGHLAGYQASPYRWVGIGGTGFGCKAAVACLAEDEPDWRTRQAAALLLRRGLTDALSIGASYRFYHDDWGLSSHTLGAEVGWILARDSRLILRYRFYTQTGVYFYRAVYAEPPGRDRFITRDREQSPMHDQRLGLEWEQKFPIDRLGGKLALRTSIGASSYGYDNFVGLDHVEALELTFALSLEK